MSIKKVELHTHLEGTISPSLYKKLAQRNQLIIPPSLITADQQSYCYTDFLDFLKAYDTVAAAIQHPRDYYDVTFDYLQNNAAEGAIYIEMMYSPDHAEMTSKGIPSAEHLAAIQQAIDDAESQFQITGRIIMTAVRHFGQEASIHVAEHAVSADFPCIVGFGLGGDEINFPPKLFEKAYAIAAAGGLHCTVHAGEHASAAGMNEAIDYLPIERIGHGVNAIHCQDTIARLKDKNIALEVCPSSNVALGLFKDLASHPIHQLREAGLSISINSDDPPFFKTNLAREYQLTQQTFGYSDEQMNGFTQMAISAAFVDEETKAMLRKRATLNPQPVVN